MPLLSQSEKEIRRMQRSMSVGVSDSQPGKDDMNDGQQQLAVIDGIVNDVKKINGDLYHNRIFKSFEEESDAVLNEESVIKVQHKFTGNPVFDPGFQSDTFSSGFAGSGYRINKETASEFSSPNTAYNIEIDNMIVRGTLSVYELLIQQIRATNGAIFVTSAAKVASASGLSATDDVGTITFDDPSGKSLCPFADGDIIMMQRVDPGATVAQNAAGNATGVVKKLVYLVNGSPSGATITVENAGFNNLSYPVEGDEFVRIGNDGTTSNRDGVIYLTSDDSNAPYIDIKSAIDSYSDWYGNVPKVRLGNLTGITYDSASLSGYGLYSENVYLTGKITASSGYIGNGSSGFTINNTYIGNGKATLTDSNSGVYVGTDGIALGASSVFKVTSAGALTASSATITGTVTSSAGAIGGWDINSGYLEKDGTRLNAGSNNGYLGIGVTAYDANDGIWLGEVSSGVYKFSIKNSDGSKYLRYTDSAFEIEAGNFSLNSSGNITATNVDITGAITATSGSFAGSLSVGSGNNILRVDTDGDLWIGHATQGSAPFQVTKAGVVTASSITATGTITAGTGSSFATGSSSNVAITTAGNTKLAQGRFEFQETGDLLIKPLAADASGNTRRGLIFTEYLDGSGNWSDYWMQYHDSGTSTDTNQMNFLYNGSNKAAIDTDGMVRSNNGFREGISSAASECEIHNNEVQIYANVSDNDRYFQIRNTDTTPGNDHRMGGLRCYATAHSTLTNNSGWNGLLYFATPSSGSGNLTGMVSVGFRAGDSATARWWKFAYDGSSTNPLGGTTWDTHSDERTKENVTTVSNALTTLDGLRPVTFNYTDDFVAKTDLPSSKKWGFVAQEFKNVISEGVTIRPKHDYDDFHMLNTDMLVPILVKAVQELKAEVEELKNSG